MTRGWKKVAAEAALLLTALIWGFSFVAQRTGGAIITPQVFGAARSLLGALVLIPVILLMDLLNTGKVSLWGNARTPREKRGLLLGGFLCGCALNAASLTQQWGLVYSPAGKAGFLTALYIVMVPVIGLFFGKKTGTLLWTCALMAVGGTYLLSAPGAGGKFSIGDAFLLLCAVLYAVHILVIARFAKGYDSVRISFLQFATSSVLSALLSFAFRDPWSCAALREALWPILYCGILSSGVAFTLQIAGQKHLHPTAASLIMSLESVFAVLGGWLLLNESLTARELLGCGIIFCAVLLVQLRPGRD